MDCSSRLRRNCIRGTGPPVVSLIVQSLWACLLCLSGSYGQLLDFTMFAQLLFYILTIAGLFVLRVKQPNAERPTRLSESGAAGDLYPDDGMDLYRMYCATSLNTPGLDWRSYCLGCRSISCGRVLRRSKRSRY